MYSRVLLSDTGSLCFFRSYLKLAGEDGKLSIQDWEKARKLSWRALALTVTIVFKLSTTEFKLVGTVPAALITIWL